MMSDLYKLDDADRRLRIGPVDGIGWVDVSSYKEGYSLGVRIPKDEAPAAALAILEAAGWTPADSKADPAENAMYWLHEHVIRGAEAMAKKPLPTEPGSLIISNMPLEDGPCPLVLRDDGNWWYMNYESYYLASSVAQRPWKPAEIVVAEE